MANHKSALKAARQAEARREDNKYYARTMRNALKKMRKTTEKAEADKMLPELSAVIDKLAKKNVIHKNKAANLKSSITKHAQNLK
ncbi:MAG: 30S ribosomal protein S20 [Bacteroidales bacterium]|jgi:small subunit ribosomal protein S20|nr:30S ribosomal protein S20 [Bacteroidales bacterium]MCB9028179.1 30S ribosomal protein S20 [Bacteroidales bacterium]MDD3736041.1 30S ribosomal protein S20 [Bacteroidales bacterium]NLD62649.1 30S ribosomal protein S20 [Bacteroidales bacterium]HNT92810.1 30S ribosomal protein S20 [Bacteroidales bacterium]